MLFDQALASYFRAINRNDYLLIIAILMSLAAFTLILLRTLYFNKHIAMTKMQAVLVFLYEVAFKPLSTLLILYFIYYSFHFLSTYFIFIKPYHEKSIYLLRLGEFLIYFWLILNILNLAKMRAANWLIARGYALGYAIFSAIGTSLQAAILLAMVNLLIPQISLTGVPLNILQDISKILLIALMGLIAIKTIEVIAKVIEQRYDLAENGTIHSRKINTQLAIIKRVAVTICMVVVIAFILRIFDSVRNIGTGILTTAGILSALGAFASQQSLGRIFAGLHIAFTQPVRIGDTVIIENELGQVEEISLSYIVIKLWDLRRLILPTDYFTGKGLLNLTRSSSELLGTIFLYADYTLPVEPVRQQFFSYLSASINWDKKVGTLQVTDIKERCMEIRALVSAKDSSTLWNLRCELREKLIEYIVERFPNCLSRARI